MVFMILSPILLIMLVIGAYQTVVMGDVQMVYTPLHIIFYVLCGFGGFCGAWLFFERQAKDGRLQVWTRKHTISALWAAFGLLGFMVICYTSDLYRKLMQFEVKLVLNMLLWSPYLALFLVWRYRHNAQTQN